VTIKARSTIADITEWLQRWSRGDRDALDRVFPLVYDELRTIAARQLRYKDDGQSVDPTDLVHTLYLQPVDLRRASWANRAQFYGVVAQMMCRILVDHARARLAVKRGASAVNVSLASLTIDPAAEQAPISDVLAVDRALERLAARDAEHAESWSFASSPGCRLKRPRMCSIGPGDDQAGVASGEGVAVPRAAARRAPVIISRVSHEYVFRSTSSP
jgi:RNA polymerase sigma-70 factor, ECF subfamily